MYNHFDTPVTLRKVTRTQNANGYFVESLNDTQVWGDLQSVKRTEFYSAEAQGHKLAYALTVPSIDWNDAERVVIDSVEYNVVRVYKKTLDLVELSLEKI
jgi:SPP1 family predicted phage head-tail adaptor